MPRVKALGATAYRKSATDLQALTADARKRDLQLRFAIVDFSEPLLTRGLERVGVTETECYSTDDQTLTGRHGENDEILDFMCRISADLVLFPAIWPETYTYALTPALRAGLPVAAFRLGAPGEQLYPTWAGEAAAIDSTYVRAHRSAHGGNVWPAPSASGL